jgi:hypothetical protein
MSVVQLAERALKEREEAKATADLQAKLEAVTLAGQESKADLERQLEEARAENEKLKEALSRSTLRPTGEEVTLTLPLSRYFYCNC